MDTFKGAGYKVTLEMRGLPPQDCLYSSPQHQTCSTLKNLVRLERLSDIFLVTRNPYDRLKSEFNWHFRDTPQEDRPCYSEWVMQALKAAREEPHYSDNHFRPAIDYLDLGFPAKIFRLEDGLEAVVEFFAQPIGSTQHINQLREKSSSSIPSPGKNLRLSDKARDAVNKFYMYDFMAFGYPVASGPGGINLNYCYDVIDLEIVSNERAKVELVRRWRSETQNILSSKLYAQCNNLFHKLSDIDSGIINSFDRRRHSGRAGALAMYSIYDNLITRLSQVKLQLEEALFCSNDESLAARSLRRIDAIRSYRERIAAVSALEITRIS